MLDEVRSAMLLQRMSYGAGCAITHPGAGAGARWARPRLLRRDDIGVLAPGKAADIIAVKPAPAVLRRRAARPCGRVGPMRFRTGGSGRSLMGGCWWKTGQLVGVDFAALVARQNHLAADLVRRAEKRAGRLPDDPDLAERLSRMSRWLLPAESECSSLSVLGTLAGHKHRHPWRAGLENPSTACTGWRRSQEGVQVRKYLGKERS